ncbi:hypothetical protein [Hyalangium gracile]|uniref:hypothetical protein n=1 Tax=Hyalangium gracile TaxID=394092 RepID=UPI001CCCC079|nr:hypothetical protein [Hyalangium gracile]
MSQRHSDEYHQDVEAWRQRAQQRLSRALDNLSAADDRRERKVRAPRFSDEEMERLALQARRFVSEKASRWRKRPMPPLEFVREAAMGLVALLEEVPQEEGLAELRQVFARIAHGLELERSARVLQPKRSARGSRTRKGGSR